MSHQQGMACPDLCTYVTYESFAIQHKWEAVQGVTLHMPILLFIHVNGMRKSIRPVFKTLWVATFEDLDVASLWVARSVGLFIPFPCSLCYDPEVVLLVLVSMYIGSRRDLIDSGLRHFINLGHGCYSAASFGASVWVEVQCDSEDPLRPR
jgi:hypothetical protein